MTKTNKLIVGGVVLVALLFLYDRNKKMKEVAMMKAQAQAQAEADEKKTQAEETKALKKLEFNRPKRDNTVTGGLGLGTMTDLG